MNALSSENLNFLEGCEIQPFLIPKSLFRAIQILKKLNTERPLYWRKQMSSSPRLIILQLSLLLLVIVTPQRLEGQFEEWCIADEQVPDDELQRALDWACGKGGADCKKIQAKQPCFYPNTVRDHASYAFNTYYQKFKHKGATCYFNSAAMVTALDPSHGSCKFEYVP